MKKHSSRAIEVVEKQKGEFRDVIERLARDGFVRARLAAAGLAPNPPGDPRALVRRAYHVLLGLPPTLERVERFAADPSPQAWSALIDELLSRPEYGQRWARHWLDVARYADTTDKSTDSERRIPFAHTYRDYVIEAFNNDLPFNQFVREQIAGDVIDRVIARLTEAGLLNDAAFAKYWVENRETFRPRAGRAADGPVALVVEAVPRHVLGAQEGPHLGFAPVGERIELGQAVRRIELLDGHAYPRDPLGAAQPGDPGTGPDQRSAQRRHARGAHGGGVGLSRF